MKELHTGSYYWQTSLQKPAHYPSLQQNITAEVAIIGGGISGLICAYELIKRGINCVVIEGKRIADGSSLASTGLLQYSSDIMLSELRSLIGKEQADLFYQYSYSGMQQLDELAKTLFDAGFDTQYRSRSSMQYTSSEEQVVKIQQEYSALQSLKLPCEYWGAQQIEEHFSFHKHSGLITHGDADVNPYLFIHSLAQYVLQYDCTIYENTLITGHEKVNEQYYMLHTDNQHTIKASHILYAVGYEPEQLKQKLIKPILNRSYVIVTNQVQDLSSWYEQYMLWETSRPYIYLRTTTDNRIMIGGLDEHFQQPNHLPTSVKRHSEQLLGELRKLFPNLQVDIEYAWNATFAESRDQLPFIGEDPEQPRVYYCLGYGGNGTVYSMMGSHIIANLIQNNRATEALAAIVKLNRN